MENKQDLVQTIQSKMNAFLESSPVHDICKKIAAAGGVDKVIVFEALIGVSVLLLVLVFGAELVVNLVCFLYPFVSSVRAAERGSAQDRSQWMTYWMTFFSFQTVESLMPHLLSSIPFYFWFKLAFMVWCYHPATRGAAVIYKLAEPIRDEILSILDPLLDGVVPAASKKQSKPTAAAAKATESDGEYVPSGITVHLDELTISPASSEEDSPSDSTKAMYVEMYLAAASKDGDEPRCVGSKYKTPPLTGSLLKFDYKLTLIPPTDILNQPGALLCFTVKERNTFGDDPVLFDIHTPIDISTLQSPAKPLTSSPESDFDLVSVSFGRRLVSLKHDMGSIKGWIELVSER